MPVDRDHAFAEGRSYSRPRRTLATALGARLARASSRLDRARVLAAWDSFETGALLGPGCRLGPNAWCFNRGPRERIRLGPEVVCRGILRRELFGDGQLTIGARVYVGDDCIVSCADRVEIGDGVLLGHGVQIFDNNSHPVSSEARQADWLAILRGTERRDGEIARAAVSIGAGAWIGFGTLVLKGVTIGPGAVVGAGSVITEDVPAEAVVVGNPPREVAQS